MIVLLWIPHNTHLSHTQAPVSMKAMCQAVWLMTVAFGNLVVIIIAEGRIFADQVIIVLQLLYTSLYNYNYIAMGHL